MCVRDLPSEQTADLIKHTNRRALDYTPGPMAAMAS